jgi:hypothetical protein
MDDESRRSRLGISTNEHAVQQRNSRRQRKKTGMEAEAIRKLAEP